ncbi:MAG: maleylpyruvate isomerase family mycothiol-dependent enzyme [Candidatus Tectomicrobia bacterium]|uniref:Maleylpyruvate isomerase family mycothiol-dependent enzyme n=1 Tax=Tectimicrobiota bacterium TaxID=2528274 RepID=A0A932HWR8_UNCTE|nr:maleylpyruvate isomerase family mycothiol-dependent enzyme [Candidatus Tectomicrobia bacterium]
MADLSWSASASWLARGNPRLTSLFRTFDEARWRAPSYCPGWTAAHVVSHMTSGARFYRGVIENGRKGLLAPPFGAKDIPEFRAIRAKQMEELLALPGAARADRFEEAVGALQRTLESLMPHELDLPGWHPRCPTPLRNFPDQRLYELILHEWDIRNEPESPLASPALGAAVEILKERLPFLWENTEHPRMDGRFRFETSAPVAAWEVETRGDKAALFKDQNGRCDARLSATASDMILLVCGRAPIAERRRAGRLLVDGDQAKADVLIESLFRPY